MTIEENEVTSINIYGPNNDNPDFYDTVREVLLDFENEYFILCGAFNLALNPSQDTNNHMYCGINNPKARRNVLEIMEDLNLLDYYRVLNPDKRIYTWHKKSFQERSSRLLSCFR